MKSFSGPDGILCPRRQEAGPYVLQMATLNARLVSRNGGMGFPRPRRSVTLKAKRTSREITEHLIKGISFFSKGEILLRWSYTA